MVKKEYLLLNIGDKRFTSHIDAIHAQKPKADSYTGKIVKGVIEHCNFSGIISAVSRTKMDLNRPRDESNAPAINEYRDAIKEIILSKGIVETNNKLTKNYLHLAIHGMKNSHNTEFAIGTRYGTTCSKEVQDWFVNKLSKITNDFKLNKIFKGDSSKDFHRNGDADSFYEGYGDKFNTIQIEINLAWRKNKQNELVVFFTEVLIEFDKIFNEKIHNQTK